MQLASSSAKAEADGLYLKMTSRPNITICDNKDALFARAADVFVDLAHQAITAKGRFCVALSGGSTPRGVHMLLASDAYRDKVDWHHVHCFWGDERCVPPTHADSNYRMADETLLSRVPIPAENVYRMRVERDPAEAAHAYAQVLHHVFAMGDDTLPEFDLIFLGMGADGHTASLFPDTTALHDTEHCVTANFVELLDTWRVTLTAPTINNAAHIVFLVSGEDKAPALRAVLKGEHQPERYPSQLIQPKRGNLAWLIDKAAADELEF